MTSKLRVNQLETLDGSSTKDVSKLVDDIESSTVTSETGTQTIPEALNDRAAKDALPTSVKDYGAVGDGSTDDTAAFQAAYDATPEFGYLVTPPGEYNIGAITGTKSIVWHNYGATDTSGGPLNVPGLVKTNLNKREFLRNTLEGPEDYATFNVRRNAEFNGGESGYVNSAIRSDVDVGPDNNSFEWALTSVLNNSATAGENVSAYFQANKLSSGPTWGSVIEMRDRTNSGDPGSALVGVELDMIANGGDANKNRIGIDLIAGRHVETGEAGEVGVGLRLSPQFGSDPEGLFDIGVQMKGRYNNCIDLSEATIRPSGTAIKMREDQTISLEATQAINFGYSTEAGKVFIQGSKLHLTEGLSFPSGGNTSGSASSGGTSIPSTASGFLTILIDNETYKIPYFPA